MPSPSKLMAFSYEAESSWEEATNTWTTRLPVLEGSTINLEQARITEPIAQQYMEEGKAGYLGPKGGTIVLRLSLTGHGGTAAGALTETDLATFLGYVEGNCDSSDEGDGISAVADAGQFTRDAGDYTAGALCRVGVLGDGRAEGQAVAVASSASSVVTLLTDMPTAATAADDSYAMQMIYPSEVSSVESVTSLRMLCQTADGQWLARGCFPTSRSYGGLNPGETPFVEVTFTVTYWEPTNQTWPNATATDGKEASLCAGGSVFMGTVGSQTRDSVGCFRSWTLNQTFEVQALNSPCGQSSTSTITGASRVRNSMGFSMVFDAEAAGTTTWYDLLQAGTLKHILVTLSAVDGRAIAFYFPKCELISINPHTPTDNLNRVTTNWRCMTGPTTTSNLTASSWRLGLG